MSNIDVVISARTIREEEEEGKTEIQLRSEERKENEMHKPRIVKDNEGVSRFFAFNNFLSNQCVVLQAPTACSRISYVSFCP